ncbi:hypothetical protein Pmar_PMAR013733 [Perkinsus marinus ATCC 50983]|uniref:Uncharacterized protein n=1 Tax=Perkinsus marinus (strain ATCC 50983 / TXsc) TaxID=423536 RepID=C5LY55_PERM5|nr:hypothetical protein Pmar_PMAR013733 [Perkinsus marinus ATCC 50983]EEQ98385.1 hypothetical protein Pmar_PMAR013733 [Perkinsus marinus ATCC 50983]|eukprot:XP_002765668.1 hypothetical protein Pmar_PMAR013733 [Perkinsus marinus ATCC 50983]
MAFQGPAADLAVAGTHLNISSVLSSLGRYHQALRHAQGALKLLNALRAHSGARRSKDEQIVLLTTTVTAMHSVGAQLEHLNRRREAFAAYRRGLRVGQHNTTSAELLVACYPQHAVEHLPPHADIVQALTEACEQLSGQEGLRTRMHSNSTTNASPAVSLGAPLTTTRSALRAPLSQTRDESDGLGLHSRSSQNLPPFVFNSGARSKSCEGKRELPPLVFTGEHPPRPAGQGGYSPHPNLVLRDDDITHAITLIQRAFRKFAQRTDLMRPEFRTSHEPRIVTNYGLKSANNEYSQAPGVGVHLHADIACLPVLGLFEQLNNLAETLPEKVAQLIDKHEHDFMLSYKSHMSTVQQNFQEWKLKAETEDDKVRRDKRVKELEGELKWFMSEALRLEALSKDYHKEVGTWKTRLNTMREERRYLEDQMKASKRQTKVERIQRADRRLQNVTAMGGVGPMVDVALSPLEEEYLTKTKDLEKELEGLRRTNEELQEIANRRHVRRAELEEYFLACIEGARKVPPLGDLWLSMFPSAGSNA